MRARDSYLVVVPSACFDLVSAVKIDVFRGKVCVGSKLAILPNINILTVQPAVDEHSVVDESVFSLLNTRSEI